MTFMKVTVNGQSASDIRQPYNVSTVQGCIFRLTCSHHELIKDHVLTSAYVKIFRTVKQVNGLSLV